MGAFTGKTVLILGGSRGIVATKKLAGKAEGRTISAKVKELLG